MNSVTVEADYYRKSIEKHGTLYTDYPKGEDEGEGGGREGEGEK